MMWGPILEKAWAKVSGAYMNINGGYNANSLRIFTNSPVDFY